MDGNASYRISDIPPSGVFNSDEEATMDFPHSDLELDFISRDDSGISSHHNGGLDFASIEPSEFTTSDTNFLNDDTKHSHSSGDDDMFLGNSTNRHSSAGDDGNNMYFSSTSLAESCGAFSVGTPATLLETSSAYHQLSNLKMEPMNDKVVPIMPHGVPPCVSFGKALPFPTFGVFVPPMLHGGGPMLGGEIGIGFPMHGKDQSEVLNPAFHVMLRMHMLFNDEQNTRRKQLKAVINELMTKENHRQTLNQLMTIALDAYERRWNHCISVRETISDANVTPCLATLNTALDQFDADWLFQMDLQSSLLVPDDNMTLYGKSFTQYKNELAEQKRRRVQCFHSILKVPLQFPTSGLCSGMPFPSGISSSRHAEMALGSHYQQTEASFRLQQDVYYRDYVHRSLPHGMTFNHTDASADDEDDEDDEDEKHRAMLQQDNSTSASSSLGEDVRSPQPAFQLVTARDIDENPVLSSVAIMVGATISEHSGRVDTVMPDSFDINCDLCSYNEEEIKSLLALYFSQV